MRQHKDHTNKCKGGIGHILRLMREFDARAHLELSEALLGKMLPRSVGNAKHRVLYNNGLRVTKALEWPETLNLCDEHKEELSKINEAAREYYRMIFSFLEKNGRHLAHANA